jgi:hypothetical protein
VVKNTMLTRASMDTDVAHWRIRSKAPVRLRWPLRIPWHRPKC